MSRRLALVVLLLAMSSRVALGASIGLSSSVSVIGLSGINLPGFPPQIPINCVASNSCITPWINAIAGASYGTLGATNQGQGGYFGHGTGFSTASARFQDVLTILGNTGTGFVQYLFSGYIYNLSFQSCSYQPNCANGFQFSHAGGAPQGIMTPTLAPYGDFDYVSPMLAFTWGVPFSLDVSVRADAGQSDSDGMSGDSADVRVYAQLIGFQIFNSAQQPVSNYVIRSAANAPYATPVPEPASLALVTVGGIVALARRRLSKRARGCGC